jgi:ligand-binding sensor domain-containing protein/signal transduction histidine kinase
MDQAIPRNEPAAGAVNEDNQVVNFWRGGQGLPCNTVNAVTQTRDGYLWVGTPSGLVRFDGLTFTLVGNETARGLKDDAITALVEDGEGALWVGTQGNGVLRLRQGPARRFTVTNGLASDFVTSLAVDGAGKVWIGTQVGLNRWDRDGLSTLSSFPPGAGNGVVTLHAGRSGKLWITTHSGVFYLQGNQVRPFQPEGVPPGRSGEFIGVYEDRSGNLWGFGATFVLNLSQGRRFNYFRSLELASSRFWTICERDDGTFWIGTSGRGLFRFQDGRFEVAGVREGLDQCDVRALYADTSDNLWIGTSGNGLARLRTRRFGFIGANDSFNSQAVSSLVLDQGDKLWIGTLDCGLWQWDGHRLEPFAGGPPLDRVTQIQTLCVDGRGALWVGTRGAGLWQLAQGRQRRITTSDGLGDNVVTALADDPQSDAVWVGTRAGSLHRLRDGVIESFMPEGESQDGAILCLLADKNGALILGTEGGTMMNWDGKTFSRVPMPAELGNRPVRCLMRDLKGRLWAGTWGGGALCRNGKGWIKLSVEQGLASDDIAQIAEDESGNFWFGTDEHLLRVRASEIEALINGSRGTVECLPGLTEEGVGDLRCPAGWPSAAIGTNGDFWLATRSGVLPLGPRHKVMIEPPPQVIIEQVLVNGRPLPPERQNPLRLGPGAGSLDFVFTAVNFNSPRNIRFRHKLENFDADWVQGDEARRAHYGPLPPGEYRFRVIAGNANGAWDEIGAFKDFVVVPPMWRSWWFLAVDVVVAVAGIWAVARFISVRRLETRLRVARQSHAMERERARIARDMHDEIGSKLTRISFLSEVARHAGAETPAAAPPIEAIASTSRDLLSSLDEMVWAVNPRNDSLEQLAGYLEVYAREYFQAVSLDCQIQVPAQLPRALLSAEVRHNVFLAFKEALNNVLKHARASHVVVVMSLKSQVFEIRVRDDGSGFAVAPKPGRNGLINMEARLRAAGGTCEIVSQPGSGATVWLRFPLGGAATTGGGRTDEL